MKLVILIFVLVAPILVSRGELIAQGGSGNTVTITRVDDPGVSCNINAEGLLVGGGESCEFDVLESDENLVAGSFECELFVPGSFAQFFGAGAANVSPAISQTTAGVCTNLAWGGFLSVPDPIQVPFAFIDLQELVGGVRSMHQVGNIVDVGGNDFDDGGYTKRITIAIVGMASSKEVRGQIFEGVTLEARSGGTMVSARYDKVTDSWEISGTLFADTDCPFDLPVAMNPTPTVVPGNIAAKFISTEQVAQGGQFGVNCGINRADGVFIDDATGTYQISLSCDVFVSDEFDNVPFIPGDINNSGTVDLQDIQPFLDLVTDGGYDPAADTNMDCVVNLLDVPGFVDLL